MVLFIEHVRAFHLLANIVICIHTFEKGFIFKSVCPPYVKFELMLAGSACIHHILSSKFMVKFIDITWIHIADCIKLEEEEKEKQPMKYYCHELKWNCRTRCKSLTKKSFKKKCKPK